VFVTRLRSRPGKRTMFFSALPVFIIRFIRRLTPAVFALLQ